jgi:hypothetical protein
LFNIDTIGQCVVGVSAFGHSEKLVALNCVRR